MINEAPHKCANTRTLKLRLISKKQFLNRIEGDNNNCNFFIKKN